MNSRLRGAAQLRRRLVGAVTWVTVVTLGVAFFIVSYVVNADQQRQLDRALIAEAQQEAREAAQQGGTKLVILDGPGPMADDLGPLTKYGALYDANGKLLSETETFHGRAPRLENIRHRPGKCFDTFFAREHLRAVFVPVPQHEGTLLLLAAPRADLDSDAAFLRQAMLLALCGAVVWVALLATGIVRRLTRGHEAIAGIARRVAEGDLSARIPQEVSGPEMAQLAHDVNRMIDRLSALLTSQREFVAHAAHEMRSPLTALYTELSLALRRARDVASYQSSIEEALDSTRRLKLLADDLLALARIDAATEALTEPIVLSDAVEAAIRDTAPQAAERAVKVKLALNSGSVQGRQLDLERLFRNLLENAIRHSPKNGVVDVVLSVQEGTFKVTISDEGQGVSEVDRARLFEPFYRAAQARADAESGAGLGLTIARRIARAHGGDVELGPQKTGGAEFIVTLPELDVAAT